MITLFFFIVFIAGLTSRNSFQSFNRNFTWYQRFRVPLLIIGILLVPMLIINLFPSNGKELSDKEYLEYLEEKAGETKTLEGYEYYMKNHPNDLEVRFKYINLASDHYSNRKNDLKTYYYSSNDFVQKQSIAYAEAYHFYMDSVPARPIPDELYSNYILAIEKSNQGDHKSAKHYLLKEIEKNPEYEPAYLYLIKLSIIHYPNDYEKYMRQKRFVKTFPFSQQRYIYFKSGQWYKYIEIISKKVFRHVSPLALIAALVISMIWMVFLRSLDVFNKEKWSDMIVVFVLGGLFTNFCLIGYDFFHYSVGAGLNGRMINDFLYCTFVIGFSEEVVKLIPWIAFIFLAKKAKEPYDYLLYASVSALGFAFVENFMYLENPGNITVRSILSTVGHMFDASLVAYGFILGRYQAKSRLMKWMYPIAGFLAGCLAHGFYDFWLISPGFKSYYFITVIFFVISVHIWFKFLNNAMNHSPYFTARSFNPIRQLNLLGIGFASILMVEYIIFNYRFGTEEANYKISSFGWTVPVFLSYTTVLFAEFRLVRGKWKKFRFNWAKSLSFFGNFGRIPTDNQTDSSDYSSYEGLQLRLFVPKSNRYVGSKFPVRGSCVGFITVSGVDNWTLFEISSEFNYAGFRSDYVIIRSKTPSEALNSDKVEILLLFIPVGTSLDNDTLQTGNLRFTGKAFARPI